MSKENSSPTPEAIQGAQTRPDDATSSPAAVQPWATLTLTLSAAHLAQAQDQALDLLEALGGLIAELEGVGGVETRDASLLEFSVERPALVVYTTPPALEATRARALAWAQSMQLELEVVAEHRDDDDWRDSWKRFYRAMRFGADALLLRPSWIAREADDPQRELVIDPGRAFGTGLHESTRLCLELLVEVFDRRDEALTSCLDLGCGSGILGLAALVLDAQLQRVHFVDIDPEAVETSRENVALNGCSARASFATAVVDELSDERYPLVLANIRPAVLLPHAEAIATRVGPGGLLILSGILQEEADEIAERYAGLSAPLEQLSRPTMNEWCAFLYRRGDEG